MTNAEIELLKKKLFQVKNYLEYGCGNSTLLACNSTNINRIVSVESDPSFAKENLYADSQVKSALDEKRLEFLYPYIGKTKEWGYPVNSDHRYIWPIYAHSPYCIEFTPDLILIDGRYRVACALLAALHCNQSVQVLIHDYNRKRYHVIERYFERVELVDTMVSLRIKNGINFKKLEKDIKKYCYLPNDDGSFLTSFRSKIKTLFCIIM